MRDVLGRAIESGATETVCGKRVLCKLVMVRRKETCDSNLKARRVQQLNRLRNLNTKGDKSNV